MSREEKKVDKNFVEDRIFTIPLSQVWISPIKKRSPSAVRFLRRFIKKHMKSESVIISTEVNEKIWSRGIEKPPRKIRVRATKDEEGTIKVSLA
jgi:large subunit ribosomal protein L31e